MAIRSRFWSVLLVTATIASFDIGAEATTSSVCSDSWIGDGYCDPFNNQPDCDYDGGDCCSCTCVDNDFYDCGVAGFACVDPEAPCVDDDDVTSVNPTSWYYTYNTSTSSVCIGSYIGDGYCDIINNQPDCQYDGGDCCSCTCDDTAEQDCGVAGFACVDPDASCVDDDDVTSVNPTSWYYTYNTTTSSGCVESFVGDGYCDNFNNQQDCQYDGGDCCSCTCVDSADYSCGVAGFNCVDPEASCVNDDDDAVTISCVESYIGDGFCDSTNNQPDCQYDGGDCCSCTCDDTAGYECGVAGFACVDPAAPCVDDDDVTSVNPPSSYYTSVCIVSYIGDGYCDGINNHPECRYDGGDCCSCTCAEAADYDCGVVGFDCVDPEASCVDDDSSSSSPCIGSYIGDGYCDFMNNYPECQYDGGDCCTCTCVDSYYYDCGVVGFACVDPAASCVDDDDVTISSGCIESFLGDGYCDPSNNQPTCQYDEGDCCSCTCVDSDDYACGVAGFACVDPEAPCMDDDDDGTATSYSFSADYSTASSACTEASIGNGYCDPDNNQPDCQYDGGDCCSCTCIDAAFSCGSNGYSCEDPGASCTANKDDSLPESSAKQHSPTIVGAVCIGAIGVLTFALE